VKAASLRPPELAWGSSPLTETTIVSGVASRYAGALFELALDTNAIDAVGADLETFDRMVKDSPDLARLVRSPVFAADAQLRAVSAVLERAGISGLGANLIKLAAQNRRLFIVPDMIRGYRALVAAHRGESTADVVSAEPLSDAQVSALKDALRGVTGGKDIKLVSSVDPSLIGGLIVKVGSRMIDTSLKTKLTSLKVALKEVR
jgi:F-type H+-transporting ATPase subunit delta